MTLRQSPLHAEHQRLSAKLVDFGGWEMPLAYPSGTITEHLACRNDAVAFDVSHLGTVRVEGPGAFESLQQTLTNDLSKISPGQAQYTHLLDHDGSVLDDIIVWWVSEGRFDVMPNAANTDSVVAAIGCKDVTEERAIIAVQGPNARAKVRLLSPEAADVPRFGVAAFQWGGDAALVAGTGYTGEDGVEIALPPDAAGAFWKELLDVGVAPAGLGARDTLRLEAGLPLHGHELGPGITPLQAGLGWVVAWDKGPFRGREALEQEKTAGVKRRSRRILCQGRQPPREGNMVFDGDRIAGVVTSGNYSPVLGCGVALALFSPDVPIGTKVHIEVRGRQIDGEIVRRPCGKSAA